MLLESNLIPPPLEETETKFSNDYVGGEHEPPLVTFICLAI